MILEQCRITASLLFFDMVSESRIYLNENSPFEDPLNSAKKSTKLMNRLERDVHSSKKNIKDYDFSEDCFVTSLFLGDHFKVER